FAYGPAGGGAMTALGAIEIAIAAPPGGAGTIWIAGLAIEDRTYRKTPRAVASSAIAGCEAERALDGDPRTSWRSEARGGQHRLEIDFGEEREYGGLIIDWQRAPRSFELATSRDGSAWTKVHQAEADGVERSYVYLPGAESRFLRLDMDSAD